MTAQYGPMATAYFAYKSMIFSPSGTEALTGMIAYLEADRPDSPLLAEAKKFVDDSSELEFDFNRMCIGPYKLLVAPYEGVYRSGNHVMNTDETVRVAEFYQEIGLVIDEKFNEPADFIGNELEFLYCVHALASEQKAANNIEAFEELTAIADEFLTKHLGTWITPFCEGIKNHAQQAFWREFATELHLLITQQMQ
ncbi:molecular chaperone TorD [Shewanella canadensis]|uniref:Molecular chaperone TorD n=1 Tax=Shewanella canadensis TaxID=271096 RepID=A0A3S0KT65_9GAMM|nr:molecular chaperone TorD family protein [Shewanella canadensis]RTR37227.1 molecular chaperone TorD [Shewanella canadensis]